MVSLELDPRGFTRGQREAVENLRSTERQVNESADRINQVGGGRWRQFFASINPSISSTNRGLTSLAALSQQAGQSVASGAGQGSAGLQNLSNQSRRTGQSVAAGAQAGQIGLKNLAVAGLEAYAALKSIETVIGQMTGAAGRGAELSRMAGLIGVPARQLDAFAQAAFETSNVPQATTIGAINQFKQQLEAQRLSGTWSNSFTQLSRIANIPLGEQDVMVWVQKISEALQGKSGPEAQYWLNQTPLAPDVNFMRRGPAAMNAAVAAAQPRSLTGDQAAELEKLQSAANKVADSYQHLWEVITGDFSKTGLAKALEGMSAFLDQTSNNEEKLKAIETVLEAVGVVLGVTLVAAIAKLTLAVNGFWALPLIRFLARNPALIGALVGVAAASPGASVLPERRTPEEEAEHQRKIGEETDRIGRENRVSPLRRAWNWIWGKKDEEADASPTAYGRGLPSPSPSGGDPRGMIPIIRAAAVRHGHDPDVAVRVASSEGLGTYVGDSGTSFGSFQLHIGGGLGDKFKRETGLDPADPKNEPAMIDWSMKNLNETGWTPYHGAARYAGVSARQGIGTRPATVASMPSIIPRAEAAPAPEAPPAASAPIPPVLPPFDSPEGRANRSEGQAIEERDGRPFWPGHTPRGVRFNSRGEPYSADLGIGSGGMPPEERARMLRATAAIRAHMDEIRAGRAAVGSTPSSTINHGDVSISGPITVHTQAKDAEGIADSIGAELKKNFTVNNANTGLH